MASIEDIIKEDLELQERERDELSLYSIYEQFEDDGECELIMYHGSPNFKGDDFNSDFIGTSSGQSDAKGIGIYLTSSIEGAKYYAGGENGEIITTELVFGEMSQLENFEEPQFHKEFIEDVILKAPELVDFLRNYSDINPAVPYYDSNAGGYTDRDTGEFVECSQSQYVANFGGVKYIFESGYDGNGYKEYLNQLLSYNDMHETLLQIESDLYSCDCDEHTLKGKDERIRRGKQFTEMKIDYGFRGSLHEESDGSIIAVVYDTSAITIKNRNAPQQKAAPKTNSMKFR